MSFAKIVHILGTGHSGSTLLMMILGTNRYLFPIGESSNYSSLSCPKGYQFVGDGSHVNQSEFWQSFISVAREKNVELSTINQETLFSYWSIFHEYFDKTILIDNSHENFVRHALLDANIEVFYIHLVRDGRAVANSWEKKYDSGGEQRIIHWATENINFHKKYSDMDNYFLLKYEEFTTSPRYYVEKIYSHIEKVFGVEKLNLHPAIDGNIMLGESIFNTHIFSANRIRRFEYRRDKYLEKDMKFLEEIDGKKWDNYTEKAIEAIKLFNYSIEKYDEFL